MQINFNKETEKLTVIPEGRIDSVTALEFEKRLIELIDGVTDFVLDMTNLKYISSAGLRVILKIQKIMSKQGTMKLTGVNENIMEILEITGFSRILKIE